MFFMMKLWIIPAGRNTCRDFLDQAFILKKLPVVDSFGNWRLFHFFKVIDLFHSECTEELLQREHRESGKDH